MAAVVEERLAVVMEAMINGILRIRLVVIVLTILALPATPARTQWLTVALALALVFCVAPLLWWSRVGPFLLRHPTTLIIDVAVTLTVLAIAGPQSPFFYFTLGAAALGGLMYRWLGAVIFSAIMLGGYALVILSDLTHGIGLDVQPTFHNLVGIPALYVIVGFACAGIRLLLEQLLNAQTQLADARIKAAAAEERTRLARQMHDSLGKTLHGLQLVAAALPEYANDQGQLTRVAGDIRTGAATAENQARELIAGLRDDRAAAGQNLPGMLMEAGREWEDATGITLTVDAEQLDGLNTEQLGQAVACVRELLSNVKRHAKATQVRVTAAMSDGQLRVDVADNGVGFDVPQDLSILASAAHYGLVGIKERASACDGVISIDSSPGRGTTVTVQIPVHHQPMELAT